MRSLVIMAFFISSPLFAEEFYGEFKVSHAACEICENMTCSQVDCKTTGLKMAYFPPSNGGIEKFCITKVESSPHAIQCYQSFDNSDSNSASYYHVGKLMLQDGAVYYDEKKQEFRDKNLISWKLEPRGSLNFEFVETIQSSSPFSGVHTENRRYFLSR